jgi:hypothetical protein
MDATILAHIVARLAAPAGFHHAPGEGCAACQRFWHHVADLITALETEVQQRHAQVVVLTQEAA